MKMRNIPFGYRMENGKIIFHPTESQAVKDIFSDYLGGQSLLKIAQSLNERQVEYLPGTTGWNKARLKRIIEDKRYIGGDGYPPIIEQRIYDKAQAVRDSRNTQKALDRTADIFRLQLSVLCEKCGEPMQRRHDSRTTYQEKWVCKSCDEVIKISDDAFLSAITECINYLIAKPNILQGDPTPTEPPVEVIRLKNEIGRMLDSPAIEKEPLKNRIFEYASLVYETLDTTQCITEMIRATLQRTGPISCHNGELTAKIAAAIILHADKTVSLTLKNGQQIRKEKNDATDSTHIAKESTHHCSDYTAGECAQHAKYYQAGSRLLPGIHQAGRTA
ncbi:recombinase family protein [Neglectibacter timonensis]|uniref:recombinase family protein n=1 Tax=Neglectibacter timonensis TaxID=1776382 RepID=UPI0039916035